MIRQKLLLSRWLVCWVLVYSWTVGAGLAAIAANKYLEAPLWPLERFVDMLAHMAEALE